MRSFCLLVSSIWKKTTLTKLTSLGFSHFCFVFSFWGILLTPKFWQLWVTGLDYGRARAKDQFYGSLWNCPRLPDSVCTCLWWLEVGDQAAHGKRSRPLLWGIQEGELKPRDHSGHVCLWVKDEEWLATAPHSGLRVNGQKWLLSLSITCSPGVLAMT